MLTLFALGKTLLSVLGFVGSHAASNIPTMLQMGDAARKDKQELEMAKVDAEVRKTEAVQKVNELVAQVAVLQADKERAVAEATIQERAALEKARAAHQAAADKGEQTILDSTGGFTGPNATVIPFRKPKGFWEKFMDFLVITTTAVNAWMRPWSFFVVLTVDMGMVAGEFYAIFKDPTLLDSIEKFAALAVVEVFTNALPMILGALWNERQQHHAREAIHGKAA